MRQRVADQPLAKPLRIPERPLPGVNLVGYLEGESGLGEVARRLGSALERADVPFSAISYRRTPSRQEHRPGLRLADEAPYDTNLVCLNADILAAFAADVGIAFFANRYSIGVWFWETNVFRAEDRAAARFLDEIWVASDYVRRAIGPEVDIPVHVVPVPVEPPAGPFLSRSELGLPDGFTFLFLFDFVSAERKNPLGVVEAFIRAFSPGEGPTLVLKCINGRERKPKQLQELVDAVGRRTDILVRDAYVPALERDSYVAACDCYVSLHRSEGFGLTLTEAMACGKPVIATGYSGNLEFMSEETSYLVPYRLVEIPDTWWAYARNARWAEPDLDAAAELMRRVSADPVASHLRGELGRRDVLARHAPDLAAAAVGDGIERSRTRRRLGPDVRAQVAQAALVLARPVGDALRGGPWWSPLALVRRALARLLWPHLTEQRSLQSALFDALVAGGRKLADLEARTADLERRLRAGEHPAQEIEPDTALAREEAVELEPEPVARLDD
jgi:glycosyltransferase involved in cell wall biosynthesis